MKPVPVTDSILCGTTMIESLVLDCDPAAKVSTLIPGEVCPGGYDLKPDDARKIAAAKLFMIHPFQKDLAEKALKTNPKLIIEYIKAPDMQVPENYFRGLQEAAFILAKNNGPRTQYYIENMNLKMRQVRETVINEAAYIMKLKDKKIKVLCSVFQQSFAEYLGFEVVGAFAGPETINAKGLSDLLAKAKASHAGLIISNMTGGHDETADVLNKQLKIKKAILISFPAELKGQPMFMSMWAYNMGQIKAACGE